MVAGTNVANLAAIRDLALGIAAASGIFAGPVRRRSKEWTSCSADMIFDGVCRRTSADGDACGDERKIKDVG